jgi:hypothetical protein
MQRESLPAGNKAVATKALGQTVSPHNHRFSPFPRRHTQHRQDAVRNQGNRVGCDHESITHHDKHPALHPHPHSLQPAMHTAGCLSPKAAPCADMAVRRRGRESQHPHANSVSLALVLCDRTSSGLHTTAAIIVPFLVQGAQGRRR